MTKLPLHFIVALLLFPVAFAANATVDGWYHLNDTINITGHSVLVKPVNLVGRVILTIDGKDIGLYDADCSQIEATKYCLKEVKDEGTAPDGRPLRSYRIVVEETQGAISIGHSTAKTSINIGELFTITLDITNSGQRKIDRVQYSLLIPDGLIIANTIECRQEGQKIIWDGSLHEGQQVECKYELRGASPGTYALRGEALWDANGEQHDEATNDLKVEVNDYELVPKLTYDKLKLGQKSSFTLSIQNTGSETVKASIFMDPPEGMEMDDSSYHYTDDLESKKKTLHNFTGRPVHSGNQTFDVRLVYDIGDLKRDYIRQVSITVSPPEVYVEHDASYHIEAGKRGTLDFFLTNAEEDPVRDIIVNVTSGLISGSESVELVEGGKKKAVWSRPFEAPQVESSTSFPVTAFISYKNKFGELFRAEDRLLIEAVPVKKAPEPGEAVNLTVQAEEPVEENVSTATENITQMASERKSLWKRFIDWVFGFF